MIVRVIALTLLIAGIGGCNRDDRPVVVLYVSADEYVATVVIRDFENQSGIRVLMVGDTEAKKTTGLVERVRAEKDNPRADVFWSSEIFLTIELAAEGLFDEHHSTATEEWPANYRDPQGLWHGFAARGRAIVYSPQRIAPEELPQTWLDLTQSHWRGRIVMADPRFGTTGGHLGAMKAYWDRTVGPGYYGAYVEGLAANRVRLLARGNAGVVEAVAKGEADLGMTDTDDVWAAQAQGLDVQLLYPAHGIEPGAAGIGTLLIPNTVAKIKGGPNPSVAKQLIDFLLSERVERILAESVSRNVPVRDSLAIDFPQLVVPDPLKIDWAEAASQRTAAINQLMRALKEEGELPAEPGDAS